MSAELQKVAQELVAPGKGILAADESLPTIEKRFQKIGVESTEQTRRDYRELLLTAQGMEAYISGVILFDETTRQSASRGTSFVELLTAKGVHPGIKTDEGLADFGDFGEKTTKGIETMEPRSRNFKEAGLVFAKARSVYMITKDTPTEELIRANTEFQARYASISQAAGLVPIVEPEVLIDGDHSLETSRNVSLVVLGELFEALKKADVDLSSILLKPSMVTSGKDSLEKATDEEIAKATIKVLKATVPETVPGIVFLSGGQTPDEANRRLTLMNKLYKDTLPWELSFSFGRALQDSALKTWAGKPENIKSAQDAFLHWAKLNSEARFGR